MSPWAPPRPCPVQSCPRLLVAGEACPEHGARLGSFANTSYQRGRRPISRQLRARILTRDGWRCRLCGGRAAEVDHIVPVDAGGSDEPSNLWALCTLCHRTRTGRYAASCRR